jgi:conjugal transfer/entry exclusion protein
MRGNDLRLIELAFDYVSAETEQQASQAGYQAAILATEATTLKVWLDLIAYMEEWNRSDEHKHTMSRASALQFFSTGQAELNSTQPGSP